MAPTRTSCDKPFLETVLDVHCSTIIKTMKAEASAGQFSHRFSIAKMFKGESSAKELRRLLDLVMQQVHNQTDGQLRQQLLWDHDDDCYCTRDEIPCMDPKCRPLALLVKIRI